jgi:hypothetical protein
VSSRFCLRRRRPNAFEESTTVCLGTRTLASLVSASPVRAGLLADKTFRDGVAVVCRLGLSYNVSVYHPQVNDVQNS